MRLRPVLLACVVAFFVGHLAKAGEPMPGFVGVFTRQSGSQTFTLNTSTSFLWNTNDTTDGVYSLHNTSSNTQKVLAPFPGKFLATMWNQWATNSGGWTLITLNLNEVAGQNAALAGEVNPTDTDLRMCCTGVFSLAASDYIVGLCGQVQNNLGSAGTTGSGNNQCGMAMIFLGL